MSSVYFSKILISSIMIILLIPAGIFIHKTGKPYNNLVFTLHKLLTIAMVIIMLFVIVNYLKVTDIPAIQSVILGTAAISLLLLFISGGMMSLDKLQDSMLVVHRITTGLFLLSYAALIYLLLTNTPQNIQS